MILMWDPGMFILQKPGAFCPKLFAASPLQGFADPRADWRAWAPRGQLRARSPFPFEIAGETGVRWSCWLCTGASEVLPCQISFGAVTSSCWMLTAESKYSFQPLQYIRKSLSFECDIYMLNWLKPPTWKSSFKIPIIKSYIFYWTFFFLIPLNHYKAIRQLICS